MHIPETSKPFYECPVWAATRRLCKLQLTMVVSTSFPILRSISGSTARTKLPNSQKRSNSMAHSCLRLPCRSELILISGAETNQSVRSLVSRPKAVDQFFHGKPSRTHEFDEDSPLFRRSSPAPRSWLMRQQLRGGHIARLLVCRCRCLQAIP